MTGMRLWWCRAERGSALVEYGLVVSLIALLSLLVVGTLGLEAYGFFDSSQLSFLGGGPLPPSP